MSSNSQNVRTSHATDITSNDGLVDCETNQSSPSQQQQQQQQQQAKLQQHYRQNSAAAVGAGSSHNNSQHLTLEDFDDHHNNIGPDAEDAPLIHNTSATRRSATGNQSFATQNTNNHNNINKLQAPNLMSNNDDLLSNDNNNNNDNTLASSESSPVLLNATVSGNATVVNLNPSAMRGLYSDAAIPNRGGCTIEFNDLSIVHTPSVTEALYTWWHNSWWWNHLWSLDTNSMNFGHHGNNAAAGGGGGGGGIPSLFAASPNNHSNTRSVFVRNNADHNNNIINSNGNNNINKCIGCCSMEPFIVVRSAVGVFGPSQIHAITTPSLASAEAIVQVILGENPPTEGSITVNGESMPAYFRLHVGIVDQRASWSFDNLTVRENMMFAAKMRRPTESADIFEERSSYLARLFHLDVAAKAEKLSVMMRLRLDIAMELMVDPAVLIVVHPFEVLDRHSHSQLSNTLIVAASVLRKTVIVTMSSLPLTLVPALDTILLLGSDDGHCLYSGSRSGCFQYFTKLQLPPLISHKTLRNLSYSKATETGGVNISNKSIKSNKNVNNGGNPETVPLLQNQNDDNHNNNNANLSNNNNNQVSTNDLSVFDENTADAIMDQVTAWSSSPVDLSRYAARFYDSVERRKLVEDIARIRRRGDVTSRMSISRMGCLKLQQQQQQSLLLAGNNSNNNSNNNLQQQTTDSPGALRPTRVSPGGSEHELATENNSIAPQRNSNNNESLDPYLPHTNNNNNSSTNQFTPRFGDNNNAPSPMMMTIVGSPNDALGKPIHPGNAAVAWFIALYYYVFTSLKSTLSHLETYVYWICLVLVLVFCAWILGKQQGDHTATQNIEGIFFLIFTFTTILNMAAVEEIYHNKRRFFMMRRGGVLGPLRYFTVKLSQLMISRILLACMVAAACRVMLPEVNVQVFVTAVGVLSFTHYSLLFLFCMLSPESWLANVALVIYTGYSLLFAGFFINIGTQGVAIFSQGSIVRFAYGISVKTFVEENKPTNGKDQLNRLGFGDDSMDNLMLILLTIGAIAWFIVFIKLKWLS